MSADLSQAKIAKALSAEFGLVITKSAVAKRQIKLGLNGVRDSKPGPDNTTQKLVEKQKERMRQEIAKRELEQLLKDKSKLEIVIDSIKEAIVPFAPEKIDLRLEKHKSTDEEVAVLMLSDLHIGKKTKSYNSEVFAERLRKLQSHIAKVINILRQIYPIKKLVIFGLGDFVDHVAIYKTHAWHVDQHTMNQIYRTGVPELCTFLQAMSNLFRQVEFVAVRGNHSRSGKFTPEELNFDLVLYETLQLACQNIKNLVFTIDWDWYHIHEIMGWKFMLTHGDVIRMYFQIPYYNQTQKAMRWQGSITGDPTSQLEEILTDDKMPLGKRIEAVQRTTSAFHYLLMGHFHTCSRYTWNNVELITNGCFSTDDDFATQVLGLKSETKQIFFGVHPKEGITWDYKLRLTELK